jgi:protein TonB
MKLRAVFFPLLLLSAAVAQESAPINLSGKDHAPICRGRDSDAADCISAPTEVYNLDPTYDDASRRAKISGAVVLSIVITTEGDVKDVKVTKGLSPSLDQRSIDAVSKWKFTPATRDGKPVAVRISVETSFKIR